MKVSECIFATFFFLIELSHPAACQAGLHHDGGAAPGLQALFPQILTAAMTAINTSGTAIRVIRFIDQGLNVGTNLIQHNTVDNRFIHDMWFF